MRTIGRDLPPVWIVSLRRSDRRRAAIAARLSSLGLPFEFADAVDGKTMSSRELLTCCDAGETMRLLGRGMTAGEIGCSLSHLALYRRLLKSAFGEAVILEDDVILDAAFPEILRIGSRVPARCELMHFHSAARSSIWGAGMLNERHRCARLTIPISGSFGYLIRRSAAEKLLAYGDPVRVPADVLCGGTLRAGVRIYGIDPPLVRHVDGESTMPDAYALRATPSRIRHSRARQTWLIARERVAVLYKRANPFLAI